MTKKLALGIDIGGSHFTCQLVDINENKPVVESKTRQHLNSHSSKETILENWVRGIKTAVKDVNIHELAGIGFAMPGPFDYPNGIALFDEKVNKFGHLHGVNIKTELLKRLNLPGNFPIRFLNDASCFAIGEAQKNETAKFNQIIALTLGTGFGTTFIKNGLPVAGIDGIPNDGFLYHVPFKKSIADNYFSTRWFLKRYEKNAGKKASGVKELAELAKTDVNVLGCFHDFGTNLGEFLVPWIQKFQAECIIIGGNISKSILLFENEINKQFTAAGIDVKIYQSESNEDAALIGSARLCDNIFYAKIAKTEF